MGWIDESWRESNHPRRNKEHRSADDDAIAITVRETEYRSLISTPEASDAKDRKFEDPRCALHLGTLEVGCTQCAAGDSVDK